MTLSRRPRLQWLGPGATPGTPSSARATAAGSAPAPTTTSVGAFAPAGKDSAISSWPWTDSTSSRNELPVVSPCGVVQQAEREDEQRERRRRADPARGARDALAHPAPEAVRLVGALSPKCGMPLPAPNHAGRQNARRPKMTSQAGRRVSMAIIASDDAHRADRAQAGGAVDLRHRQAQQRGDHREPGGEDRRARPCAARSPPPRACPRGGAAPRGSARRAAARSRCPRRTRAPSRIAGGLPVDRHPRLGDRVAEAARRDLREHHGEQRDHKKTGLR